MGDGNELSQLRQLGDAPMDAPLGAPGAISVDGIEVPVDQQCNFNVWTPSVGDVVGAVFGADTNDTCEGEPDISGGWHAGRWRGWPGLCRRGGLRA